MMRYGTNIGIFGLFCFLTYTMYTSWFCRVSANDWKYGDGEWIGDFLRIGGEHFLRNDSIVFIRSQRVMKIKSCDCRRLILEDDIGESEYIKM